MGQTQSPRTQAQLPAVHPKESARPKLSPQPSFEENEGVLKLRKVPFRNSVQISEHPPLFLQNIPETLADVLQQRYNTNKYFSEYQIQQFVESVLYTLSFLETKNVTYPDLSIENIHFDQEQGIYKLLPLELIKQGIYQQALKSKSFGLLSPQLILGLRYKQKGIEEEIMNKSNVFTFGMILLEIATLQPSIECYDTRHNEILDDVITERLEKVQETYHPQIQKLIEMMIEYDYTKRMNLQELSILVNKTLAQTSVIASSSVKRNKSFSRFRNIQESLSNEKSYDKPYQKRYEKPERDAGRESLSRINEKSAGSRTISPSRLKANTVLPVNYHQTPKRQSIQYPNTQPSVPQEPPTTQQPQFMPRQKSSRRIQYDQEHQMYQEQYQNEENYPPQEYNPKSQPYPTPNGYSGYPPQPMYPVPANYSRVVYCPQPQIPYQQTPYQQPSYQQPNPYAQQYPQYPQHPPQHYQYPPPQYQIPQPFYEPVYTPKSHSQKPTTTTIYPSSQKFHQNLSNTQTYYEPQNEYYDYNPPQRPSSSAYYNHQPSSSLHQPAPTIYQQPPQVPSTPSRMNPYINYQQPPSKQLYEQQYEDSFSKSPSYSPYNIPTRSHNYTPPHRDSTSYILKQSNAQKYDRKSSQISDLSDSSIVKIKEEIAKSRELIMELQKNDSGHRR